MKKILLAGNSYCRQIVFYPESDSYKINTEPTPALNDFHLVRSQDLPGGVQLLKYFIESSGNPTEITTMDFMDYNNPQPAKSKTLISSLKETKQKDAYQIEKTIGVLETDLKGNELQKSDTAKDTNSIDLFILSGVNGESARTVQELSNLLPPVGKKYFIVLDLQQLNHSAEFLDLFVTKHPKQTIAIIHADLLRESGVRISKGLSWDKTLEETLVAVNENAFLKKIKSFHSLLILFGNEAILYVYHKDDNSLHSRFYFIPDFVEGQIAADNQHVIHGESEAFLAALANGILFPYNSEASPIHQPGEELISVAILAGINARASCIQSGYRHQRDGTIHYPVKIIFHESPLNIRVIDSSNYMEIPPAGSVLNYLAFKDKALIAINAALYVKNGKAFLFDTVPYAQINKLKTYIQSEIEDFRSFEKLIVQYVEQDKSTTPISIAVFGAPGSGKSFGVKQIAGSLKSNPAILEFNLSGFQSHDDLIKGFHTIRDECLRGEIPFVFFDEFDSEFEGKALGWLKYFLAPMQDGVFKEGESLHPVGKAIFVFAGGTCSTFEKFESRSHNNEGNNSSKLPDFISRLKGFINIQGIDQRNDTDTFYPLRRAIVLRNMLAKYQGLKNADGAINIDDNLLGALLEIPVFKHGARSLETIIRQSNLDNARSFTKSNLPAQKLLSLHLDTDTFEKYMEQSYLPHEALEKLAKMIHNDWLEREIKKGTAKPSMKPWDELQEQYKDSNRQQAIDMVRKLNAYGYSIVSVEKNKVEITAFSNDEIERMAQMEHERWVNEKIANGWTYGKPRTDNLKIHDCLLPWNELDEATKDNDRNPLKNIPELLQKVGFAIVKAKTSK